MRLGLLILRIKNRSLRGFTLVETLVCVTIFSVIALGVGGAFFSGTKIWQHAKNVSLAEGQTLLAFELLNKELRQSLDYPFIGFKGTSREISFPLLVKQHCFKVTYRFDPEAKALWRSQLSLQELQGDKEDDGVQVKKMLSADEAKLEFFSRVEGKSYQWKESWDPQEGIPLAVRFEVKIKDETFNKTIFIPIS